MHFLGAIIGADNETAVDEELSRWSEYTETDPYVIEYRDSVLDRAHAWVNEHDEDGRAKLADLPEDELLERFVEYDGGMLDEDGNLVDTIPEDTFFDWYEMGGRWNDVVKDLQGLTVGEVKARAAADPKLADFVDHLQVVCHNGDYETEPVEPFAGCGDGETVWFIDFHD